MDEKNEKKLRIVGIIPARLESTRFPRKPFIEIKGIPMLKRVYLQVAKSKVLDDIYVSTPNDEIREFCEKEGIKSVKDPNWVHNGTDSLAAASEQLDFDLYVNIQGDEPVISPETIDLVVEEFKKYGDEYIAYNLYKEIGTAEELNSNSSIKTIVNEKDELVYMSRSPIPFNKSKELTPTYYKQVCVYGFTKKALDIFSSIPKTRDHPKTKNERFEDIEILRFIDLGYKVKMKETTLDSIAVDYPRDIKLVEEFLENE